MIGLPYMLPDHFCDTSIAPFGAIPVETFLYRHLALLTGRVIDCLQDVKGPSLSGALKVEEQMDDILAQLPSGYLDIRHIRACTDQTDKKVRLYRAIHFYQLRAYVHLPLMLRSASNERLEFSHKSCIGDSRRLLEAYLELFDSDASAASDGTVLNFTASIAAVVLLLSLFGYGRPKESAYVTSASQDQEDWRSIYRTMHAIKQGQHGRARALCQQCFTALECLVTSASGHGSKTVLLPYFGTISITRGSGSGVQQLFPNTRPTENTTTRTIPNGTTQTAENAYPAFTHLGNQPSMVDRHANGHQGLDSISLDYSGPYTSDTPLASWQPGDWSGAATSSNGRSAWTTDLDGNADWSWLNADLPPSMSF